MGPTARRRLIYTQRKITATNFVFVECYNYPGGSELVSGTGTGNVTMFQNCESYTYAVITPVRRSR